MAKSIEIPKYGQLYFDHLHGEFALVVGKMSEADKTECLAIQNSRDEKKLTWNNIYTYELILLKYLDHETLKSKIISLRLKYQNLVDVAEYNNYLALRAVDLTERVSKDDLEKLRADYKYLLDEFYLRYAYTSTREGFRARLLRYGALSTLAFFIIAALFTILTFKFGESYTTLYTFSIFIIVVFAGIMGAFVSMQQRLQSFTNQGDPIYNLSLLTHGWLSIFLSPISGAVFAIILYLFFASGILTGSVFPKMRTDAGNKDVMVNSVGETPDNPKGVDVVIPPSQVGIKDFVEETGPQSGGDLALLLIWSFIAGFAERFVPDTLMRLVNQKKPNENAET